MDGGRAAESGPSAVSLVDAAPRDEVLDDPRPRRRVDGWLVGAVLLGTALRLWDLGQQSLWYDEWHTREVIDDGWRQVVPNVANGEGLPYPYFICMWMWRQLFGLGEVALRLPSAMAGIAAIPVAYAAARELQQSRLTARVAGLLVAVHPMLVWYSQEARTYSLLALSGALSLWALARVRSDGSTRSYVLWGLTCALLISFHYYGIFLVGVGAVVLLASRPQRWTRLLRGAIPVAVAAALLAPIAVRQRSNDPGGWIEAFDLSDRLNEAGTSALVGPSPFAGGLWKLIAVLILVATAFALATLRKRGHGNAMLIAVGTAAASVVLAVLADVAGINAFVGRYLLAALIPLIVATAAAMTALRPRLTRVAALAVLTGIMVMTVIHVVSDPALQRPQWREVADVAESGSAHSVVVMNVHGRMGLPLLTYMAEGRALDRGEAVAVDQVDVVHAKPTDRPCNFLVGHTCGFVFLGAPLPDGLANRFTLDARIELDQFTLVRYRTDSLVRVSAKDLVPSHDEPRSLLVVRGS